MKHYLLLLSLIVFCYTPALFSQDVTVENAYPSLSFSGPMDFQLAPGIDGEVFIAERRGTIQRIVNDPETTEKLQVLDIISKISTQSEGGLLGIAFHPDFESSGLLYVYYTADSPFRSVFARFETDSDNPDVFDPDSEHILFEVDQPAANHNGGQIRFGPDGYLYIALGDGGGQADQFEHGQDLTTLHGNILRIDVDDTDGDLNYAIPEDNPFVGNDEGWREEIFAWGFRNPFRFSFDRETGDLWVADVGERDKEEVNLVEKGKNYGWSLMEGSLCFPISTSDCDTDGLELPVFEYGFAGGQSITGGFMYRGEANPELNGRYFFGDFITGDLWSFEYDGEEATDLQSFGQVNSNNLSCFGEDHNGELYMCMLTQGQINRITMPQATSTERGKDLPETLTLHQNYPNPFNPVTTIRFDVPEDMHVRLDVYDILGRRISTLTNRQYGAGTHEVQFDASEVSSGVYLYRMVTDAGSRTSTMQVIK